MSDDGLHIISWKVLESKLIEPRVNFDLQRSDRSTHAGVGVFGVGDSAAVGGEAEVFPQVLREDGRRRS